jgi:diguanylate cyclase (GGDEF)-like protein
MADDANKKSSTPPAEGDSAVITRVINPQTDTLQIDLEAAKASDAVLIIIRGSPQGKRFELKGESFVLGRDKGADIQIVDPNISRSHSRILKVGADYFIEDAGSRNGTFVNDESVAERKKLNKEDMIRLGSTVLKYLPAGELETLYHANLADKAYIDQLTDVYNRNYINEVLEVEFKRARALHTNFSIIVFDIDNFKKINDTYGHDCGDYVLRELGQTVKESGLRSRDYVGRFGGEEFVIILTSSHLQQAGEVAERVRKNIESHKFIYDNNLLKVTISLGVACIDKEHLASELYRKADAALYQSKNAGKNKTSLAK